VGDMVERTSTDIAPWTLVEANNKYYARIKILKTLCEAIEKALVVFSLYFIYFESFMWIDTHCHFDVAEFDPDREQVAQQAWSAGVEAIAVIAYLAEYWPQLLCM
jgi:hypothetical protein